LVFGFETGERRRIRFAATPHYGRPVR